MVSKSTDSLSKLKQSDGIGNLAQKMNQIKKQIQAERVISIKRKLEENGKNLEVHISQIKTQPFINRETITEENVSSNNMLSWRIENPIWKLSGYAQGFGDRDQVSCHDFVPHSSTMLSYVERLPPYTTWIFLDRNQRMGDDQSVLGRRRIYYDDQHGSEALICSDSEEEIVEHDEDKREFTHGEDQFLLTVFRECGLGEEVVRSVSSFIGATSLETEERYNTIVEKSQRIEELDEFRSRKIISMDKSLAAALDSFDNLFCRRCMVFDCRLHGCSQNVIHPTEKQLYCSGHEEDLKPCSNQCYLSARRLVSPVQPVGIPVISVDEQSVPRITPVKLDNTSNPEIPAETLDVDVSGISQDNTGKRNVSDDLQISSKKQKRLAYLDMETGSSEDIPVQGCNSGAKSTQADVELAMVTTTRGSSSGGEPEDNVGKEPKQLMELRESKCSSDSKEQNSGLSSKSEWKQVEKELYMKGLEIFGRNSCLIARNLLSGLKTCLEVSSYMHEGGVGGPSSFMDENGKNVADLMDQEIPKKRRLVRRRGKARKLKYSTKSAGHPSIWKRIAYGKNQSCKQYTPCSCTSMCGKDCSCQQNETCCEKYCGCSKSCKNRFRGCHCAKSQCRSRQCPCFAADRECDPDVCRNCWVSCGDGTLDEPPRQGDGQCGNMRLLLRQQQRIILSKSDVAGWGAFIKNSVNKNDYLGEYTGEMISHREADKRGKIYDRANSSFLFDLNDQYVLDAYRKGDKLKFANHSANPNCYAKVMLVAGDHRVGIFAKDNIEASEEIFYDYRYGPAEAPIWARKPEGSKRDDTIAPQGRAKKHQSH